MTKILLFTCLLIIVAGLSFIAPEWPQNFRVVAPALAQQTGRTPLYRYQSRKGHYLYATSAKLPAGLDDGPWESEGLTCYVPEPKPHGTTPVYQLMSQTNDLGTRYFFTTDLNEVQTYQTQGWSNQGTAFHIASVKLAGTVPVYRLYKGLAPQVKKDKSLWDKISEAISGPEFTQETAGVLQDAYFYTISEDEKAVALKGGFIQLGILGYAWPPTAAGSSVLNRPDLVILKTIADATSVTALLKNQGVVNTGGIKYEIALLIYDKENNLEARLYQTAPALSPDQTIPVKFDTAQQSVVGKRYQVVVDEPNAIKESKEKNNATEIMDGPGPKIKTGGTPQSSIPLALNLLDVREIKVSSGQLQGKLTAYDLAITNASKLPADAFQQLPLPPNPCADKSSKARLQAEIIWGRQGKDSQPIMRGTCIPLGSPQDLAKMTFSLSAEKGTASLLQVIIHDRLTGIDHKSNVYPVGAFGIAKVLSSVGCYAFIGRPDDFTCSTSGMAACENLQQQGKPIKCRPAK